LRFAEQKTKPHHLGKATLSLSRE